LFYSGPYYAASPPPREPAARALDSVDREYLAPYAAELLVDCTADALTTA
jgi:hypothetical protein